MYSDPNIQCFNIKSLFSLQVLLKPFSHTVTWRRFLHDDAATCTVSILELGRHTNLLIRYYHHTWVSIQYCDLLWLLITFLTLDHEGNKLNPWFTHKRCELQKLKHSFLPNQTPQLLFTTWSAPTSANKLQQETTDITDKILQESSLRCPPKNVEENSAKTDMIPQNSTPFRPDESAQPSLS